METPFWTFSLDLYGRKGVAALCLEFQEEAGADVNILLFLLWLADQGYEVNGPCAVAGIEARVSAWHTEIVKPLRAVRWAMRTWPVPEQQARDAIRADLQKVEIGTEQLEQAMLYTLVGDVGSELLVRSEATVETRMRANLAVYLSHLNAKHLSDKAERLVELSLDP